MKPLGCFLLLLFTPVTFAQKMFLYDSHGHIYSCSSELKAPQSDSELGPYGMHNLFDDDPTTAWAEGEKTDGNGVSLHVLLPKNTLGIYIINGYAKSETLFKANNRIKELQLSLSKALPPPAGMVTETGAQYQITPLKDLAFSVVLKDSMEKQHINFSQTWNKLISEERMLLTLTISSIYKGTKYNDTCLSELKLIQTKTSIEFSKKEDEVFLTKNGVKKSLLKDPEYTFQLVEATDDFVWLILIRMPAQNKGRTETEYLLFNTSINSIISSKSLGVDIVNMYGFEETEHTYLLGSDRQLNDIKVNLDNIVKGLPAK